MTTIDRAADPCISQPRGREDVVTTGSLQRTESINQTVFADQNQAGEWAGSQEETPAGRVISSDRVSVSQGWL